MEYAVRKEAKSSAATLEFPHRFMGSFPRAAFIPPACASNPPKYAPAHTSTPPVPACCSFYFPARRSNVYGLRTNTQVKHSCASAFCNLADLPAMHSRLIEEGAVSTVSCSDAFWLETSPLPMMQLLFFFFPSKLIFVATRLKGGV